MRLVVVSIDVAQCAVEDAEPTSFSQLLLTDHSEIPGLSSWY
jgi:hypothetical protein